MAESLLADSKVLLGSSSGLLFGLDRLIIHDLQVIGIGAFQRLRIVLGLLEIQKLIDVHGLLLDEFDVFIQAALPLDHNRGFLHNPRDKLDGLDFLLLLFVISLVDIKLPRKFVNQIFGWLGSVTDKFGLGLASHFDWVLSLTGFEQALARFRAF